MPGIEHANWVILGLLLLLLGPVYYYIHRARKGHRLFVRRIPGVDAVDEAMGRAVEMGRPMMFTTGLVGVSAVLFACLGILKHVARRAAGFGSRLIIPQVDPEVMAIVQSTVEETYRKQGRQELYRPEDITYLSGEQFAFASGYMGIAHREKVAACYLFGTFAAESLILAEAGQQVGAIQVAGTVSNEQIPFFITTCDYTIIGEELYATGAYLSKDPVQTGSLRGQDVGKLVIFLLILTGLLWGTVRSLTGKRMIQLWNAERAAPAGTLKGHPGRINAVAYGDNGAILATGGDDRSVRLWDPATGEEIAALEGHTGPVNAVTVSRTGAVLASAGRDLTIRLWDLGAAREKGKREKEAEAEEKRRGGETGSFWDTELAAAAPTGKAAGPAEAPDEGEPKVLTATLEGHTGVVSSLAFSPDGAQLASGSLDRTVKIWNAAAEAVAQTLTGHEAGVSTVAFSPDGKSLASAGLGARVLLWDAETGDKLRELKHPGPVTAVAFSPDGQLIATACHDKAVRIWRSQDGELLRALRRLTDQELEKLDEKELKSLGKSPKTGHGKSVMCVAFSPDGKLLASGGLDRLVILWDVEAAKIKRALLGQKDGVSALAWSPDGTTIATASTRRVIEGFQVRAAKFFFGIYKAEED